MLFFSKLFTTDILSLLIMGLKLTMLLFWFSDEYSRIWIVYDLLGFFLSFSFWSHYSSCLPSLPWFIVWMIEVMIILIDFSLKAYLNFRPFFWIFHMFTFFPNFEIDFWISPEVPPQIPQWGTSSFELLFLLVYSVYPEKLRKAPERKSFLGPVFFCQN